MTVQLRVGPFGIRLIGGPSHDIARRYKGYLNAAANDLELRLEVEASGQSAHADPRAVYFAETRLQERQLSITSTVVNARIDFAAARGYIKLRSHPRFGCIHYLENALRQVAQILAVSRGGLLLHASAVVRPHEDVAFVFMGRSGSGKTTISRLLQSVGGTVLSDDLVLVEAGAVSGTPFFGDLREPLPSPERRFPTGGLYVLEKAPDPSLRPIAARGQATAELLANLPFVECLDRGARERSIEIAKRVASATPFGVLRFRKDLSVLSQLDWKAAIPA
ncbi:MAG: hypothetical protein ACKVX7_13440 [Planctomycetota bacterium]